MARTSAGDQLTSRHRQEQLAVRAAALRDLQRLWRIVDPTRLRDTIPVFSDGAATIVQARHQDSADRAVDYFERFRRAEGASGSLALFVPDPPDGPTAAARVRAAGLSGILNHRRKGFPLQASTRNGFVKAAGTTSNLVMGAAREVITNAIQSDPLSTGRWRRVTGADPCDFCEMLASRGAVFAADTAGFEAHDNDGCMPEPEFS